MPKYVFIVLNLKHGWDCVDSVFTCERAAAQRSEKLGPLSTVEAAKIEPNGCEC